MELSPYQKATKTFFQFMGWTLIIISLLMLYNWWMQFEGVDLFLFVLLTFVGLGIFAITSAHSWAGRFSKSLQEPDAHATKAVPWDKEQRARDWRLMPAYVLGAAGLILIMIGEAGRWPSWTILMFGGMSCIACILLGWDAYTHEVFRLNPLRMYMNTAVPGTGAIPFTKERRWTGKAAKRIGIGYMVAGILFLGIVLYLHFGGF